MPKMDIMALSVVGSRRYNNLIVSTAMPDDANVHAVIVFGDVLISTL